MSERSPQEGTEYSRRGVLAAIGVTGSMSAGSLWMLDHLNDFEVENVELDPEGFIVEAGATESDPLGFLPLLPENAPLTLSSWIAAQAADDYPHGFVEAVAPHGEIVTRRLLSKPSPSEVLRSERFYRVETAQTAGDHVLRLADSDGNAVETATISISRRKA